MRWLLLACLCVDLSAEPSTSLRVHVRVDQPGGLSTESLTRIAGEMAGIWREAGVEITSGRYEDPVPPGRALVLLRFVTIATDKKDVLGWVAAERDDGSTPTVFVSLTGVHRILDHQIDSRLAAVARDRIIAQAMGRIAAHELGHYLLRRTLHQDTGLMRPVYFAPYLVSPSRQPFRIPVTEQEGLREELARIIVRQSGAAAYLPLPVTIGISMALARPGA